MNSFRNKIQRIGCSAILSKTVKVQYKDLNLFIKIEIIAEKRESKISLSEGLEPLNRIRINGVFGKAFNAYLKTFGWLNSQNQRYIIHKIDLSISGSSLLAFFVVKNSLISSKKIVLKTLNLDYSDDFEGNILAKRINRYLTQVGELLLTGERNHYPTGLNDCEKCDEEKTENPRYQTSNQALDILIPTKGVDTNQLSTLVKQILPQLETKDKIYLINDNHYEIDCKTITDSPSVEIIQGSKRGIAATRNVGVNRSASPLILFIDSDDLIESFHIKSQREIHNRFPNIAATGVHLKGFGDVNYVYPQWDNFAPLTLLRCLPPAGVLMWNRKALEDLNNFNESFEDGFEDFDLVSRATVNKKQIVILDQVSYFYRRSLGSLSNSWKPERELELLDKVLTNIDHMCSHRKLELINFLTSKTLVHKFSPDYFMRLTKVNELKKLSQKKYIRYIWSKLPSRVRIFIYDQIV